ncbi:MAG: hypothetical protein ACLPV8_05110 [Steroidobacteraceae bacterium]
MPLSRDAKLIAGITLLLVPTIQFGGLFLLGLITQGGAGTGAGHASLNETQMALFRAGHAHAGVWLVLSLVVQVLLDSAKLSASLKWLARIAAPVGTIALSGGFFGLAFHPEFRFLLYFGAIAMFIAVIVAAVGLLRNSSSAAREAT